MFHCLFISLVSIFRAISLHFVCFSIPSHLLFSFCMIFNSFCDFSFCCCYLSKNVCTIMFCFSILVDTEKKLLRLQSFLILTYKVLKFLKTNLDVVLMGYVVRLFCDICYYFLPLSPNFVSIFSLG